MVVTAAEVASVASGRDPDQVDELFRRALADVVPTGLVHPRWIAGRDLCGVFEGWGAVRDFADWCDAFGADPFFDFGPPPEVILVCLTELAGHTVRVSCTADEREAGECFRLNPGWGID